MKRSIIILSVLLLALASSQIANSQLSDNNLSNSKYLDDTYFWPTVDTVAPVVPMYNRNAREFIFLEDTTQRTDTVRMRIVEK